MSNENRANQKDADGLTSEQRKQILAKAKEYVLLNSNPLEVSAIIGSTIKEVDSPNCYTVYQSKT